MKKQPRQPNNQDKLSNSDLADIIIFNKILMDKIGQEYDCDVMLLNKIFNNANKKADLVSKAAYVMGAIATHQPFYDGNKRTALSAGVAVLAKKGYRIQIKEKDSKKLVQLLHNIMMKGPKNSYPEIEKFLSRQIKKYNKK